VGQEAGGGRPGSREQGGAGCKRRGGGGQENRAGWQGGKGSSRRGLQGGVCLLGVEGMTWGPPGAAMPKSLQARVPT
jgi:hypothetical protein